MVLVKCVRKIILVSDRHKNRDATWWREYRQLHLEHLRQYKRKRWILLHGGVPRWNRFKFSRRPTQSEVALWRSRRLQELSEKYTLEEQAQIKKAMLNPELAELIKAQTVDARSFKVKYDPSYDEAAADVKLEDRKPHIAYFHYLNG